MEANELMIGDWVNSYDAQAYKVTSIHINDKGCAVRLEFDEYIVETWTDKIEQIPLTEEILKLNGFIHKETMEEWWHEEYDPVWGMRMSDFELTDEFKFGRAKLTYVHELQHALRLCGLNDIADNFKVTE